MGTTQQSEPLNLHTGQLQSIMSDILLSPVERRYRADIYDMLSEAQSYLDAPKKNLPRNRIENRIKETQNLLDEVKTVMASNIKKPYLDRIATIEDNQERRAAQSEFRIWKADTLTLLD